MRRHGRFVTAALLTLAVGIGATTTVFSVVYGVLLRPLPYPQPHRIVRLSEEHPGAVSPLHRALLSNITYHAWVERGVRALDGIAVYIGQEHTVGFPGAPERVQCAATSPELFSVLRAVPGVGRFFHPREARAVVLSDGLWRERFRADAGVVGDSLDIDGEPHTVVGVTRPGFHFPDPRTRLWVPLVVPRPLDNPRNPHVIVFFALGRLRAEFTAAEAGVEGTVAAQSSGLSSVGTRVLFGAGGPPVVRARTLVDEMTAPVRPALLVLMASVTLVLLVACVNVANLFLSRSVDRRRELAICAALGATRARLARQLLTESVALSALGGALAVVLAWILLRLIPILVPPDFPRLHDVQMNKIVLVLAAALALFAAVTAGIAPALRGARFAPSEFLQGGNGVPAGGGRAAPAARLRDALVVTEAAFAVVLLVGAALLARSFVRLTRVDPGYSAANVLTASIYLPGGDAASNRRKEVLRSLLERLRTTTGVTAAGGGTMMPLDSNTVLAGFPVTPLPERTDKPSVTAAALTYTITPGYAEALGLRLRSGRLFTDRDATRSVEKLIVNEEFARMYLPGHPVGVRLRWGEPPMPETAEIVGIVANVLKDGNERLPQPEVYKLLGTRHLFWGPIQVVVRTASDPLSFAPPLRGLIRELAPDAAVEVLPLAQRVAASVGHPRFRTVALSMFAALALVLTTVGLYGLLSYSVSQRRREWGVRVALGATRADLIRLVLREGFMVAGLGLVVGLGVAAGLARFMESLLFGITPLDPVPFVAAPAILVPVALAACLVPALRAAAIDPAEVLRGG
jgi:predicted permease